MMDFGSMIASSLSAKKPFGYPEFKEFINYVALSMVILTPYSVGMFERVGGTHGREKF